MATIEGQQAVKAHVGEGAGRRSLAARAEAAQREMTPERARQLAMELGG